MKVSTAVSLLSAKTLVKPAQTAKTPIYENTDYRLIRTKSLDKTYFKAEFFTLFFTKNTLFRKMGSNEVPMNLEENHGVISPPWAQGGPPTREGVIIGFDAEWQVCDPPTRPNPFIHIDPTTGLYRKILSQQFATPFGPSSDTVMILYPQGRRYPFSHALALFLDHLKEVGHPACQGLRYGPGKSGSSLNVTLVGHYGLVDLTTFRDRDRLLRKVDSVHRTLVTVEKPIFLKLWDANRNAMRASVHLRDTISLVDPSNAKLESIGKVVGIPKVELPTNQSKSEMERFMRECPGHYSLYAAVDAVIPPRFLQKYFDMREIVGIPDASPPITTSGESAKVLVHKLKESMQEKGMESKEWRQIVLGLEPLDDLVEQWDGSMRKKREWVPNRYRALAEGAWSASFYGGRNEALTFGLWTHKNGFTDLDIRGAYAVAMSLLPAVDYSIPPTTIPAGPLRLQGLNPLDYAALLVRFKFPDTVNAPCLPVKDPQGGGLIFPVSGETYACLPELYLALRMGAEVEVLVDGYRYYQNRDLFPWFSAQKFLIQERSKHEKGSPENLLFKLLCNGGYGKLGQGLRGKRAYSPRHDASQDVPNSLITHPVYASTVTALVRALLSATVHQLQTRGHVILSMTTDGFLSTASVEEAESCDAYGFRDLFLKGRKDLGLEDGIWEEKHKCREAIIMRTRGGVGIGRIGSQALPIAKAGYKVQPEDQDYQSMLEVEGLSPADAQAIALVQRFASRTGTVPMSVTSLPPVRDYVRKGADGQAKTVKKLIPWDFDYKRVPVESEAVQVVSEVIPELSHIAYSTRPLIDIDEFHLLRQDVKDSEVTAVKTGDDLTQVMTFHRTRQAARKTGKARVRESVNRTWAVHVLRHIRQLGSATPAATLLPIINETFGVNLTVNDFKLAGRKDRKAEAILTEDSVPLLWEISLKEPFDPTPILTEKGKEFWKEYATKRITEALKNQR